MKACRSWRRSPVCAAIGPLSGLCIVSRLGCGCSYGLPKESSLCGGGQSVLLTVYYLFSLNS